MSKLDLAGLGVLAVGLALVAACGDETGTQADIPPQDPDLRGTEKGTSHLSEVYVPSHHGDGTFQVAVIAGTPQHHWNFGPMPPMEGPSEAVVDAITAFVRERQRVEGFEAYPLE